MIFQRGIGGSDPADGDPVTGPADLHEHRQARAASFLASATLACPACDAPVALAAPGLTPADRVACPFCDHAGALRDFLALGEPTRPTRVELHVVRTRRVTR